MLQREEYNERIQTLKKQLVLESEQTLHWKCLAHEKHLDLIAEIAAMKAEIDAKSSYIIELRGQLDKYKTDTRQGNYSIQVH